MQLRRELTQVKKERDFLKHAAVNPLMANYHVYAFNAYTLMWLGIDVQFEHVHLYRRS